MFNKIAFIVLFVLPSFAVASELPELETLDQYYGSDIHDQTESKTFKNDLHQIISSSHLKNSGGGFDKIVSHCDFSSSNCYKHNSLGYKTARRVLFGSINLREDNKGEYFVISAYCQDSIDNSVLPTHQGLGPMKIPANRIINTEHSWPQSKFSGSYSKSMQKSDLHALYPVRMKVNTTRGSLPFGYVTEVKKAPCSEALLGKNSQGTQVFEPSNQVKGDVARSLFYFSTRYKLSIDPRQEAVLREWHKIDPVDSEDLYRNNQVYRFQHNRNPFTDHPEWVDQIDNF